MSIAQKLMNIAIIVGHASGSRKNTQERIAEQNGIVAKMVIAIDIGSARKLEFITINVTTQAREFTSISFLSLLHVAL